MGFLDRLSSSAKCRIVSGPSEVYVSPLGDGWKRIRKGEMVGARVSSADTVNIGNDVFIELDEHVVALEYKGVVIGTMTDETDTLRALANKEAIAIPVILDGIDRSTSRPKLHAMWKKPISDARKEAWERKEHERELERAREDLHSIWINCPVDSLLIPDKGEDKLVFGSATIEDAEVDGKNGVGIFHDDEPIMGFNARQKAYRELSNNKGNPINKVMALRRDGDYGRYWRVKVTFDNTPIKGD